MSSESVRRAQLVMPFGVGAITVTPDGTAVVTAGLDHWFESAEGSTADVDIEEFMIEEWRLQEALKVSHFRLPPDHRRRRTSPEQKNMYLRVPALRFPRWNFCPRCRHLEELPLSYNEWRRCEECARKTGRKGPVLAQVPFVAMCERGHLQDFPFREWAHRQLFPTCTQPLRLVTTGSASLGSQVVKCDCGAKRTLAQVTEAVGQAGQHETFLTRNLARGQEYLCRGSMPWHGTDEGGGCGLHVRASLRAASNLYFALVRSSIYLPRATGDIPDKLIEILTTPPLSTALAMARALAVGPIAPMLRGLPFGNLLTPFRDDVVDRAIAALVPPAASAEPSDEAPDEVFDNAAFRHEEYAVLRSEIDTPELKVRAPGRDDFDQKVAHYFDRVMLVEQLRETRALWGFNRVFPEGEGLRDRKAMLWKTLPDWKHSWLPAYIVKGEGIFLEFDADRLSAWEHLAPIKKRVALMAENYQQAKAARQLRERDLPPRFVLLHTVAHLLINQLTFECGYSSASLRERLYVSEGPHTMAAILIYTAAGDSEGTMGGLVRMGKPGYIEPALRAAIDGATWCSTDPVCMELSEGGQGPDSSNLAACHNCCLVPETACEEFNRFLDRGVVVGTLEDRSIGFFSKLVGQ